MGSDSQNFTRPSEDEVPWKCSNKLLFEMQIPNNYYTYIKGKWFLAFLSNSEEDLVSYELPPIRQNFLEIHFISAAMKDLHLPLLTFTQVYVIAANICEGNFAQNFPCKGVQSNTVFLRGLALFLSARPHEPQP